MKYLTTIIFTAGLASAANLGAQVVRRQEQAAATVSADVSAAVESGAASNGASQLENVANIFNGTGLGGNVSDPNFDPAALGGNFGGNVNIDGLNLNSVDLTNQNDIINAILAMMNALCLGGLFNSNSISNLGGSANLQLFLQLAQLMQLQQLGFLGIGDIQSLLLGSFGNNNFNGLNGLNSLIGLNGLNGLNGLSGFNNFNFGVFKRSVEERKKTMKRTTLRRSTVKALSKRQCQAGVADPNATAVIDPNAGAAATQASEAPAATQPSVAPAATQAPAVDAAASQPAPAAQTTRESRPSDFT